MVKKKKKVEAPAIEKQVVDVVETPIVSEEVPEVKPVEEKKEKSIEEKILEGQKERKEMEKAWRKRNNIPDPQTSLFSLGINGLL